MKSKSLPLNNLGPSTVGKAISLEICKIEFELRVIWTKRESLTAVKGWIYFQYAVGSAKLI